MINSYLFCLSRNIELKVKNNNNTILSFLDIYHRDIELGLAKVIISHVDSNEPMKAFFLPVEVGVGHVGVIRGYGISLSKGTSLSVMDLRIKSYRWINYSGGDFVILRTEFLRV